MRRSDMRDMHTYRGCLISRHGPNGMGLRWIALNPRPVGPLYLGAGTLAGMK